MKATSFSFIFWALVALVCTASGLPENDGEALIIFATEKSIQGYGLKTMTNFSIAQNLRKVKGVIQSANYTYWYDVAEQSISRINFNNGSKREVIVTTGLNLTEDIAIDCLTGNVYFVDSSYKYIGVCNDNGDYCTVLIHDNIDEPSGIALMPSTGKMYWSDRGKSHIATAYMDGSKREIFVEENMGWPDDLSIDYMSDRLYWLDAKLYKIECINLDGSDRRIIIADKLNFPNSIAILGNCLYWSDRGTHNIYSCDKFTGKNLTKLVHSDEALYDIDIYQPTFNVNLANPCFLKPCSQLCLLTENQTYTCACTLDTFNDSQICADSNKHIAIASGNSIAVYHHVELGRPDMASFHLMAVQRINAMTYDPLNDTLIVVVEQMSSIFRYDPRSNQLDLINVTTGKDIECAAFDYLGNNLYMIVNNKIEILSLNTGEKIEFSYPENNPLSMILIPEEGLMFVVFRSDKTLHIDRVHMSCLSCREHVIEQGLVGPKISLAYDEEEKRVFWTDEEKGHIESIGYDGNHRRVFSDSITSPNSIAVLDDKIFWSSRGTTYLSWADKNQNITDIKSQSIDVGQLMDVPVLQSVKSFRAIGNIDNYTIRLHPCRQKNGNCSHVCLVTNAKNRLCACPLNFVLDSNMKTCKINKNSCTSINSWVGLIIGLLLFITYGQ